MKTIRLLPGCAAWLALSLACAHPSPAQQDAGDELTQMVATLLNDADKDVRAIALEQVRTASPGRAATERFAALLPGLPRDAQVGLLGALADRGDSAARPAVVELLAAHSDESVRVAAISALGFLGEPGDSGTLIGLLEQGSGAEQAAARASLIRLSGAPVPGLIAAAMRQAAPPLRVTLLEILAARRATDTVPEMLEAAVADDPSVRAAAMAALGQLAGPEHMPGLAQGVLKAAPGRERETAEKAIMFVCGRLADTEQRAEPLLAAMDALDTRDRTVILPTLGRIGGPAALPPVEAAIRSADPAVHDAGVRALCNWPDASIAPRLIELARNDAHADHQTRALRAVIRVASLPDGRPDSQRLELLGQAMAACQRDAERHLVLQRASAIRAVETLRFLRPYLDQPALAQQACLAVVELAHHRNLREAHKDEFLQALDQVIQISQDATVIDRAQRYKRNQTWVRPRKPSP